MSKKKELKIYSEAELIQAFNLNRLNQNSNLLNAWLDCSKYAKLHNEYERVLFEKSIQKAQSKIRNWSEEDLKMYFIANILNLANFDFDDRICALFEKKMQMDVNDEYILVTRPDFLIAKGVLDLIENPYFHFQEYKKDKESTRDPLGQLLKAFVIAANINHNKKPLYGAYIMGRFWYFVVYENNSTRDYCVSKAYDSTQEDVLMQIIAILRHFKVILETVLLVD